MSAAIQTPYDSNVEHNALIFEEIENSRLTTAEIVGRLHIWCINQFGADDDRLVDLRALTSRLGSAEAEIREIEAAGGVEALLPPDAN